MNDEEFLLRSRCVAESNLIKAKIIFKLHNSIQLSQLEFDYL